MNRNLHSPTKLTEFARDFEEESETLFTKFVNKLTNAYNTSYNSVNELQTSSGLTSHLAHGNETEPTFSNISRTSSNSSLNSNKQSGLQVTADKSNSTSTSSTNEDTSESVEKFDDITIEASEGRTMLNVLKRISNIIAAKNSNLRNYKDTELHRFWMPDSKAKQCYDCSQKFSTFRRKHHCRLCGQIFCSKCCNQVVPGRIIMCSGDLKVCTYCSKLVLSYLQSRDITLDLKADLQALQNDLSNKLSQNQDQDQNTLSARNTTSNRKISVGYQEERLVANQATNLSNADRKNILQQSNSLKSLHEEMIRLLPQQNCGTELISFLNTNQKSSNKIQAIAILNAMLEAGFLVPIVPDSDNVEFDESLHYKFVRDYDVLVANQDVDYKAKSVHMTSSLAIVQDDGSQYEDPYLPKSLDNSLSFQSVKEMELENSIRSTTTTAKELVKAYCEHEELLLSQVLRNLNLDQSWSKILITLCARAVNQFRPEFCTNDLMDIRNYVNFKKVPGGSRSDCSIVGGVGFTKNVAHKEMATRVDKPKILLLQCPIVYERVEGKFVSIETLLLQEKEYLRNVTARILSLKANVVLVHKNVAGIAQDMLRSHGITLVLDVKSSVMERLARCLQCDIVTSIESNIGRPKLGSCDVFYIKNFDDGSGSSKTLMFFEIHSSPPGCCCLLRGTNNSELARVKKAASLLVYARYNWRLETSFLLDEFARPPSPKLLIFDSKEHTPSDNDNVEEFESKEEKLTMQTRENMLTDDKNKTPSHISNTNKRLIERKSEEKLVTIENVSDFTDPLRAPELSPTKYEPESSVEFAVQTPYDNRFRTALSSTVLSVSPFVSFPLPYLETEQGCKCPLRSHFPNELYFSKQWSNCPEKPFHNDQYTTNKEEHSIKLKSPHEFVKHKITAPIDNRELQTLLAEFRSFGGRYPKTNKMVKVIRRQDSYQKPQKVMDDYIYKDALDLENHQRLPVLFCSFYYNPKAPSSFCAQPTLLDMKFYGQHDIMLGQFLQRYCFRSSYICPSCNLPMMGHVRRYVHSMGCVHVFLTEDTTRNDSDKIFLTSWCQHCNEITPNVPISPDSFCLSFAKYLELRFHGHAYKKRVVDNSKIENEDVKTDLVSNNCNHSLHKDYIHHFSYKGIGAKFMYTPIEVWEISLPPLILHLKKPKPFDNLQVLEDIKNFSVKGHEVYSKVHERIAELATEEESLMVNSLKSVLNRDQLTFRQHVEIVQTLLTEKIVHSYDINDAMLMAKRALAESIELWGPRLHEATVQAKIAQKQDSNPQIDPGTICTEDLKSDIESPSVESKQICEDDDSIKGESILESSVESPRVEGSSPHVKQRESISKSHHENVSDKKTIKQLLSQLMPSANHVNLLQSPISVNEHLTLPLGVFPILVHDQDLSSIIAYSLVSADYKKAIENLTTTSSGYNSDTNSSPNIKRKSQDGFIDYDEKDMTKTEEDKKSKSNCHIDMFFQDSTTSFTCKIYFAKEFDAMRANILKPPKLEKTIYKDLELSKKREEIRISQQRNSGSSEGDILRKASGNNLTPLKLLESAKDATLQSHCETDEARTFFARSLCRSVQWEARGGKSGSKFSKTLDDRFVLKEMSKTDIGIFENFASNYFEYLNKCLQQNQPTLLAKILGVFKVATKKKDSMQEKTLLVMENLFYDCDIKNKFDLKGSERNRLVDPTNQNGEIVLLDENLIQMSWFKPLYILSHSKTILREAINRDSSFLERNEIMDYSLLVGLDSKESVLVLGIIDYIRTFTFDKRLESIVKQSGLLGGQGKLPTVISPQRYKQRFIEAMDRYFYSVPDRWEGLSKKYNTDRFREDYIWDRSSSEPNLSVPQQIYERWPIKFPHEFISVDELKFFRRKPPPHGLAALHTNSSICLFNKDEPVFPFSYVKSEYERQYQNHLPILRPGLTRKSTSLKLDGFIDGVTEQKAKYLRYPQEEILRCRASPTRYPQNLTLSGDLELEPEYKSSYISHPSISRSTKVPPRKTLKLEGIMDVCKKDIHITQPQERLIGQPAIKVDPPKCQLKLEGEMSYVPEYRSQYIQFPIEKSHSIPQLSNIKFQGDFTGVAEYTESFKFYDNYSKSAPIKKADHIILKGKIDAVPEYKEKFKEPNISSGEKAVSLKTEDHLQPNGEFGKDLPEYYESFKDPHITKMPERGRCREPYLRLKGKIEFNPEYRSTYLDYPRSRPIVQKSVSSLRLSNSSKSPFDTPKRKFKSISPKKFHDPNVDIPIACRPEYRKAKHEYQIRERPLARKITEGDSNGKTIGKSYKTSGLTGRRGSDRNSKISPRKRESSPKFKLKVEHFDDVGDTTHKSAPKFGRRASVSRNAHNIREKTGIIEGNQKYVKGPGVNISSRKKHGADDQSFLVLQEPCKKSSWMEKSWYET